MRATSSQPKASKVAAISEALNERLSTNSYNGMPGVADYVERGALLITPEGDRDARSTAYAFAAKNRRGERFRPAGERLKLLACFSTKPWSKVRQARPPTVKSLSPRGISSRALIAFQTTSRGRIAG